MLSRKGWLRHLDFIAVDLLSIEVSMLLTWAINVWVFGEGAESYWQLFLLQPMICLLTSFVLDTYNGILQRGYVKEFIALFKREFFMLSVLLMMLFFFRIQTWMPRKVLVIYFLLNFPITYGLRFDHKFRLRRRYNNVKHARQIVVGATEEAARKMIMSVTESAIRNYQFFGLAVLDKSMVGQKIEDVTVNADADSFIQYVKEQVVDEVFLNLPDRSKQSVDLAQKLLDMGLTVHIYMESPYQELPNRCISNVFGYNVLTSTISPISFRQTLLKRFMDICGGLVGCLLTVLIGLIIGPVIYIKSPGPIFFSQTRMGKKGRRFKIYKFRSMYMDAEARKKELMEQNKIKDGMMFKMDNDPRIIKGIGHFIRKTSLDEFPQFWNVLKGDMSLVGTRPPTIDEYERYSPHHKRRLSMLPGITGLWQTSGRSNITDFEEVVRLDTEYIENWSLEMDIKILFRTVAKLVKNDEGAM